MIDGAAAESTIDARRHMSMPNPQQGKRDARNRWIRSRRAEALAQRPIAIANHSAADDEHEHERGDPERIPGDQEANRRTNDASHWQRALNEYRVAGRNWQRYETEPNNCVN